MKYFRKPYSAKRIFFTIGAPLIFLLLFSCARKMDFGRSAIVPAAEGTVKIKTDKNDNYSIEIDVKHLAPASQLTPSKEMYVVWMETENHGIKNIGQLKSSEGFLSDTFTGSLETVTPFEPEGFFITAEDDAAVQYYSTPVILAIN